MKFTQYDINEKTNLKELVISFKNDWKNFEKKVFFFQNQKKIKEVKNFYYNLFKEDGVFYELAEDARIEDREKQKTKSVWMEVRFDPTIKNAYRHSANAQPLHTDGSYNPYYPNSTLMCCEENKAENGETIFIDSEKVSEILKNKNQSLFNKILNHNLIHERSGDKKECPILKRNINNIWNVNWNYYCITKNLTEEDHDIKERFQNFLLTNNDVKENLLEIKMEKGDALIWKDNEVLHGRNAFSAKENSARFIWKCAVNF